MSSEHQQLSRDDSTCLDLLPQPVLLDATSVRPDVMLLLDTFFTLVVFHGATIAAWRDAGYQYQPDHANFKQLLEQPLEDAQNIIEGRD